MKIHYVNSYSAYHVPSGIKRICRWLLVDILPTVLILMLMACAMLLVARYAESCHAQSLISDGQLLQLFFC